MMRVRLALAVFATSTLVVAPGLWGCAAGESTRVEVVHERASMPQEPFAPAARESEESMSEEQRAVLEAYEAMQQAMIDKNIDALRALTTKEKPSRTYRAMCKHARNSSKKSPMAR